MKNLFLLLVIVALSLSSAQNLQAQRGTDIRKVVAQLKEDLNETTTSFSKGDSILYLYYGDSYFVKVLDYQKNGILRAYIVDEDEREMFVGVRGNYLSDYNNAFVDFLLGTKGVEPDILFVPSYWDKLFFLYEKNPSNDKWITRPPKFANIPSDALRMDVKARICEFYNRGEKISVYMIIQKYDPNKKMLRIIKNDEHIGGEREIQAIIEKMIFELETLPPTNLFMAQERTKMAEQRLEKAEAQLELLKQELKNAKEAEKVAEKTEKEALKEEERVAKEAEEVEKGEDARRKELEKIKRESDEQIKKNADEKAAKKEVK